MEKSVKWKKELNFSLFTNFLLNINFLSENNHISFLNKLNLLEFHTINIENIETKSGVSKELFNEESNSINELQNDFKKLFVIECDIDFYELYNIYKKINFHNELVSSEYTINEFFNISKILVFILQNFNKEYLQISLEKIKEDDHIKIFKLKERIEEKNVFNRIIEEIMLEIEDYKKKQFYENFLSLFNLATILGKIKLSCSNDVSFQSFAEQNLYIYSLYFLNDIRYFLLISCFILILNSLQSRNSDVDSDMKNLFSSNIQRNSHLELKDTQTTIYYFDNILDEYFENEYFKMILIINNIKYFIFNQIWKNTNHRLSVNFEVIKNLKNYTINPLTSGDSTIYFKDSNKIELVLAKYLLISYEDLNFLYFKNILLLNFKIYSDNLASSAELEKLFKKYDKTISKCKYFLLFNLYKEKKEQITPELFLYEIDSINICIKYFYKIYKAKLEQKENFFFLFNHHMFSVSKLEEGVFIDNIKLHFRFFNLKNEELLGLTNQASNFLALYFSIKEIIKNLIKFKKLKIEIYLCENIENQEIKNILLKLALCLQYYIEDKNIKILNLNETKHLINTKYILILNNIIKEKEKKSIFLKRLKHMNNPTLLIFWNYWDNLLTYFNEIVIHDQIDNQYYFNPKTLLRNFSDNKIIIKNLLDNCYSIDIYIYCDLFYQSILEFVKLIKSESNIGGNIKEISLIIKKQFFEDVLSKQLISTLTSTYCLIDNFCIISKSSFIDYDVFFKDKKLCIYSHKYLMDFDYDVNNILNKNQVGAIKIKKAFIDLFYILKDAFRACNNKKDHDEFNFKNSTLFLLLNTDQRFFTHFCFIFKNSSKSNFSIFDLTEKSFSLKKIINNKNDQVITSQNLEIFYNHEIIKNSNTKLKFCILFISIKEGVKLILKSILTMIHTIIKETYHNIELLSNLNINSLDILFDKFFVRLITEPNMFHNYNKIIPILFSCKFFEKFVNIGKNLSCIKNDSFFTEIYIIENNNELNIDKKYVFNSLSSKQKINLIENGITKKIKLFDLKFKEFMQENNSYSKMFNNKRILKTLEFLDSNFKCSFSKELQSNRTDFNLFLLCIIKSLALSRLKDTKILNLIKRFYYQNSTTFEIYSINNPSLSMSPEIDVEEEIQTSEKVTTLNNNENEQAKYIDDKNGISRIKIKDKKCLIF